MAGGYGYDGQRRSTSDAHARCPVVPRPGTARTPRAEYSANVRHPYSKHGRR